MKNKKQRYIIACILLMLTLAGCHSVQQGINKTTINNKQKKELLTPLTQPYPEVHTLTAKIAMKLDYNQQAINLKGRLRMHYDEGIQVSITALGLVEVALIECTPKATYIIDRINKRYARWNYTSGILNNIGINFNTIQALFWNRLFIPGKDQAWEHTEQFNITTITDKRQIEPTSWSPLKCLFDTDNEFTQLLQTKLSINNYEMRWNYNCFEMVGEHVHPMRLDISLSNNTQMASMNMILDNIVLNNNNWKIGTNLSIYKEVELDEILSSLNIMK